MPTVLFEEGFRVMIFPEDHEPPHVHVLKAGGEAKIRIDGAEPVVLKVRRLSPKDEDRALSLVSENQQFLLECWEKIDGCRS